MPLDPPLAFIAKMLADAPPQTNQTLEERRKTARDGLTAVWAGRSSDVVATDYSIEVDGSTIPVRVTRPSATTETLPAVLFLHGGGWFQGDLDTADAECGPLTQEVPCIVVSVAYRLAPEHPFPIPLEDCLAGYRWLHDNADALGIDVTRVAVAGASAGANLAAALCLLIRDQGLPMPVAQLLDVPFLDLTMQSDSLEEHGYHGGLTLDAIKEFVDFYLGKEGDPKNPLASPLLGDDLSRLPPAFITVAELDPVRDDGERFLTALHEAGVPASCVRVNSHFHGGWVIPITMTAGLINDLRVASMRRAFAGTLVPNFPG